MLQLQVKTAISLFLLVAGANCAKDVDKTSESQARLFGDLGVDFGDITVNFAPIIAIIVILYLFRIASLFGPMSIDGISLGGGLDGLLGGTTTASGYGAPSGGYNAPSGNAPQPSYGGGLASRLETEGSEQNWLESTFAKLPVDQQYQQLQHHRQQLEQLQKLKQAQELQQAQQLQQVQQLQQAQQQHQAQLQAQQLQQAMLAQRQAQLAQPQQQKTEVFNLDEDIMEELLLQQQLLQQQQQQNLELQQLQRGLLTSPSGSVLSLADVSQLIQQNGRRK